MEVKEWFNSLFRKIEPKEKALTAEEAYFKTKYGVYRTVEQRIKDNQKNIKELIKSKVTPAYKAETKFSSFYCVIDLDDELKPYVNDIFKPFDVGRDLAREFHLADAGRPALARQAKPAEIKARQLP